MAQYKVPQDVEADDKLIGPFSFRQFVYLLIAGGLIGLAVLLFQLFPLLVLIPILPTLFFLALALPLKKDQPMETYLAAIVSYYLKPHKRIWVPGQRESTVTITAPKIVEKPRTRDISEEEATHRLSFLADIMDTEGQSIKGVSGNSSMREDLVAEANMATDMFDNYRTVNLDQAIDRSKTERHEAAIKGMQEAIDGEVLDSGREREMPERREREVPQSTARATIAEAKPIINMSEPIDQREEAVKGMRDAILKNDETISDAVIKKDNERFDNDDAEMMRENANEEEKRNEKAGSSKKADTELPKPSIIELANNPDFSVATIAKEANRINGKEEGEVFISLH